MYYGCNKVCLANPIVYTIGSCTDGPTGTCSVGFDWVYRQLHWEYVHIDLISQTTGALWRTIFALDWQGNDRWVVGNTTISDLPACQHFVARLISAERGEEYNTGWFYTGGNCSTPTPTPTPTVTPTPTPTPTPTGSPTPTPVNTPTPTPTHTPTPTPTHTPTLTPTPTGSPGPTPTPMPTPTGSPGPTPTPTPGPQCWGSCSSSSDCPSSLTCQDILGSKRCVNPNCTDDSDCSCPSSTPTPTAIVQVPTPPSTGNLWPTALIILGGLLLVSLGFVF